MHMKKRFENRNRETAESRIEIDKMRVGFWNLCVHCTVYTCHAMGIYSYYSIL